ncbi:MAG: hypothetical protein AAGJ35_04540 [Myxococcota bacterium]
MPVKTMPALEGMNFVMPEGFSRETTILSFREEPSEELQDPRMMQGLLKKNLSFPANVTLQQRTVALDKTLNEFVEESLVELKQALGTVEQLKKVEFTFEDQASGYLLDFSFATPQGQQLRQLHALRLDGKVLSTACLTTGAALTKEREQQYLKSLASLRKNA